MFLPPAIVGKKTTTKKLKSGSFDLVLALHPFDIVYIFHCVKIK